MTRIPAEHHLTTLLTPPMQGVTTVSPQLPRSSLPSVPVPINASNLKLLATSDDKSRIQDFVASQARYAKAQANEGRAVRAAWDISTPEKEKMNLHKHQPSAGFETPILKPRAWAAQIQPDPDPDPEPPPHPKASPANKPGRYSPRVAKKKGKGSPGVVEAVVVPHERQKRPNHKSTTDKKSRTAKVARKERRARSDTDEEHLASMSCFALRSSHYFKMRRKLNGCDRASRATGTQAYKAGDYGSKKSQSQRKRRKRE
jgi:hypothetical protein